MILMNRIESSYLIHFSYYDVNWIDKFELTRPFHKGEKDKSNEFAVSMFDDAIEYKTLA